MEVEMDWTRWSSRHYVENSDSEQFLRLKMYFLRLFQILPNVSFYTFRLDILKYVKFNPQQARLEYLPENRTSFAKLP